VPGPPVLLVVSLDFVAERFGLRMSPFRGYAAA